jgi:hypothetical protein
MSNAHESVPLASPSLHTSFVSSPVYTTSGASLPASLAIAAALDVATKPVPPSSFASHHHPLSSVSSSSSSSNIHSSSSGPPSDSVAISIADERPTGTINNVGTATTVAGSGTERKSAADPRDLVLTLCPIKSNGDRPAAICGHTCSIVGSRLFLYGGAADFGRILPDLYTCDVSALQWERLSTSGVAPPSLFGHSSVIIKVQLTDSRTI